MYYYTLPSFEETHISIQVIINRYGNTSDSILSYICIKIYLYTSAKKKNIMMDAFSQKATQARLCWPYVEAIGTKIIWSSSPSGSPFRNIHISNDDGSFTFYVYVFVPLSLPPLSPDVNVSRSNTATVF